MLKTFDSSIVRILSEDGQRILGAGFLISRHEILTCAHVIAYAFDLAESGREQPTRPVLIDFKVAPAKTVEAYVVDWHSEPAIDIAVLHIDDPSLPEVSPVELVDASEMWGHTFRAFGFPRNYNYGVWVDGRILDRDNRGFIQLECTAANGYRIEQGFSGTPVWDTGVEGIVGVVVESDVQSAIKSAFMLPTSLIRQSSLYLKQTLPVRTEKAWEEAAEPAASTESGSADLEQVPDSSGNVKVWRYVSDGLSLFAIFLLLLLFLCRGYGIAPLPFTKEVAAEPYSSLSLLALVGISEVALLWYAYRGKWWHLHREFPFLLPPRLAFTTLLNLVASSLSIFLLLQSFTLAAGASANPQDSSGLQLLLKSTRSDWQQLPAVLPANFGLQGLMSSPPTAVEHVIPPSQVSMDSDKIPAYHVVLQLKNRLSEEKSAQVTEVEIVIQRIVPLPQPLNVWQTKQSNFETGFAYLAAYHAYQSVGAHLTAGPVQKRMYVYVPAGQSQLIDVGIYSTYPAAITFTIKITYVIDNKPAVILLQPFSVYFSDESNWHPYHLDTSGHFVAS